MLINYLSDMVKFGLIFSFFFIGINSIHCQESRIHKTEVSDSINTIIEKKYSGYKHLKFYSELINGKQLIEAEFQQNHDRYSLLFDKNELVEVEIYIDFDELDSQLKDRINTLLNQQFSSFKLIECQIVNPGNSQYYELEISGTRSGHRGFYEMYFDKNGELIEETKLTIQPIPTQF